MNTNFGTDVILNGRIRDQHSTLAAGEWIAHRLDEFIIFIPLSTFVAFLTFYITMAMLPRAARPALAGITSATPAAVIARAGFHSSTAQAAPLRETEQRIKSVKNIEKITKSMKMIASTKLNKAQRAMAAAKAYGVANNEIFVKSEAVAPEGGRQLFVVVSSDKGLCGGIHSSVTKRTKAEFKKIGPGAADAQSSEGPAIIVLGEKSKAQLSRSLGKNIALSFNQVGKDVPTYADAAAISDQIIKSGIKFDKVNLIYNKYVSAISFESDVIEVYSEESLRNARKYRDTKVIYKIQR